MSDKIENTCRVLFESYTHDITNIPNALNYFIESLKEYDQYNFKYTQLGMLDIIKTSNILATLGTIIKIEFEYIKSDGILMSKNKTTLYDMLKIISDKHTHNLTYKNSTYTCEFHRESLFVHLHLVMLISIAYTNSLNELYVLQHAFIGLIHDIGKYSTAGCVNTKDKNKWTKFPCHGEIGAGILSTVITTIDKTDFSKYFNKTQMENMARTVCVHMCGYHETDRNSIQATYTWSLLRLENQNVKEYLYYLSYADHFGACRDPGLTISPDKFLLSRNDFKEEINKEFRYDEFFKSNCLDNIIILVRGMSRSGKSVLTSNISKHLKNVPHIIIERDAIMCDIVAPMLNESATGKKVSSDKYKKYYEIYKHKNLGSKVNAIIKQRIIKALADKKMIILDSVISLFKPLDYIIPQEAKSAFIIAIDVIRNELLTDTLDIQIHGTRDQFYWLPEDTKNRLRELSSMSTSRLATVKNVARPRLVHTVSWTNDTKVGINEVFRQLDVLIQRTRSPAQLIQSSAHSTDEMDIITYFNYLYNLHGFTNACAHIREQGFTVCTPSQFKNSPDEDKIIRIKYLDNNRLWKPKWSRQCRGVILYKETETNWICIKYQLQRGAEMLTSMHIKANINETETCKYDTINDPFEIFSEIQQDTMRKLLEKKSIDAVLTSKSDGSLLGITFYSGKLAPIMRAHINNYGDPFSKAILKLADICDSKTVPIISSQSTFFLGEDMQDYVTTVILSLSTINDIKINELSQPHEMIFTHGKSFMNKLIKFYNHICNETKNEVITISFEAICKDRKTLWGKTHNELAISYETSSLKLLSVSYGDLTYKPHYEFSDIIAKVGFDEPLWWKVQHTNEIDSLLTDLSKCIRNKLTTTEFLKQHPPNNKTISDPHSCYLDYEGFVIYTQSKPDTYDYGKIKTEEYYKAHKYRVENVAYLIELHETSRMIFPLTHAVKEFYSNTKITLIDLCNDIIQLLNKPPSDNLLFQTMPEKAKQSFNKQPMDIKMKMLINASDIWKVEARKLVNKNFPLIAKTSIDSNDIDATIKGLIMTLHPWDQQLDERINKMISDKHVHIANLFNACINTSS